MLEVGLRLLGVSYPLLFIDHHALGSARPPGIAFWHTDEGNAFVRINRAGFRDREYPVAKAPNTVRIAVLGDSYVEAIQLDQEEMFTTGMARGLRSCRAFGERAIEVMNFGVTGYGTAQELLMLRHKVAP